MDALSISVRALSIHATFGKQSICRPFLALAVSVWAVPGFCQASDGPLSISAGFDYSSGKYGEAESTDILYIPIVTKYVRGPWILKLTVPYIEITGPGNVVPDIGIVGPRPPTRTRASGFGDVIASASYAVYDGGSSGSQLDLAGKIKFGTASRAKGLGTGENDYAVELNWVGVAGRFLPFASLGYRITGSPPGVTLNNVFYGSLGGSYKLGPRSRVGVAFDLSQQSSEVAAPQRELSIFASQRFDSAWKLGGYLAKGYSNGSPDWAIGATLAYAF